MQSRALATLLLLGMIWGSSFFFIKLGLQSFTPALLVAMRMSGAALLLCALLPLRGLSLPRTWRGWGDMFFVGIVGTVFPYLFITWGEQYIPSGLAAILNATTPLFSILIALGWTKEEQLSLGKSLGVLIGFAGVVVAVGLNRIDTATGSTWGQLAILGASFCYAISGLYARKAFRNMASLVPAAGTMLSGALVITPIALAVEGLPTIAPSFIAVAGVTALTLLCTVFAYILFYWLLDTLGASRTSMVTYLLPPFALVYGWLWLGEHISMTVIIGLLLVLLGILVANGMLIPRRRTIAASGS